MSEPTQSSRKLSDIQREVDDWIGQWDSGYWRPLSNLARLTEEVGELARLLNLQEGDKPAKESSDRQTRERDLAEEFGDVLFVLVTLANSLEVDLDAALEQAMRKYDVRDADRHE